MRRIDLLTQACDPKTLTVGQLMQDALFTCTPRTDALTIGRLMTKQNFGGLPVVGDNGILVGLVTEYDLLQAMIEGRDLHKVLASEIMTTQPLTVREEMLLEEVANLFQDRYVTRLPVVRGKTLVGLVARRDLLHGYMKASDYWS
ncbi:MAG TPA: CBS domain-containing protein [Nitrospira sp.]|jgi:CBS domain-containing protein|nr:CBS domain-containing protein [Nitrospira sp.]MCC7471850.1 CBS domain-containing protein [Candidatus Nomurabacteria bacterium]HNN41597.1 CBS domain-containing protein [Nitrospira sp.]HUM38683.1 CBS domain-containing protein [Nitrospira sp.]